MSLLLLAVITGLLAVIAHESAPRPRVAWSVEYPAPRPVPAARVTGMGGPTVIRPCYLS